MPPRRVQFKSKVRDEPSHGTALVDLLTPALSSIEEEREGNARAAAPMTTNASTVPLIVPSPLNGERVRVRG